MRTTFSGIENVFGFYFFYNVQNRYSQKEGTTENIRLSKVFYQAMLWIMNFLNSIGFRSFRRIFFNANLTNFRKNI